MNYETAKKLKENGFKVPIGANELWQPDLSTLIKACGDGFGSLTQSSGDTVFMWGVSDIQNKIGWLANTPEEAVAMLWLALNKKDKE